MTTPPLLKQPQATWTEFPELLGQNFRNPHPRERARVLHILIERIDYDGRTGDLDLTLSPTGVALLAAEASDGQAKGATA